MRKRDIIKLAKKIKKGKKVTLPKVDLGQMEISAEVFIDFNFGMDGIGIWKPFISTIKSSMIRCNKEDMEIGMKWTNAIRLIKGDFLIMNHPKVKAAILGMRNDGDNLKREVENYCKNNKGMSKMDIGGFLYRFEKL